MRRGRTVEGAPGSRGPRRRRVARGGPVLATTVAVVGLAGCTDGTPSTSSASFALTSADVHVTEGDPYPVNLLFVAPEDDPVWDGLTGVALAGRQLGPDEVSLERGGSAPEGRLGNVTFTLDDLSETVRFSSVELFVDGADPYEVAVGSWAIVWRPEGALLAPSSAATVARSTCGSDVLGVTNVADGALTVRGLPDPAEGVRAMAGDGVEGLVLEPGEPVEIEVEYRCDEDVADVFAFSPVVEVARADGEVVLAPLDPVTVGLTSIDDEAVTRIASR